MICQSFFQEGIPAVDLNRSPSQSHPSIELSPTLHHDLLQDWKTETGQEDRLFGVHFPIPQIDIYTMLTNLQFAFKFVCRFIIRERTLCSNEVENLLVVTVVVDATSNQLSIPYYAFHMRSALNQKIPLASYLVHLFFLPET